MEQEFKLIAKTFMGLEPVLATWKPDGAWCHSPVTRK